jgi:hypothetical protein
MRLYTTTELANQSANLMARSFSANLMRIQPNGAFPLFGLSGLAAERRIQAIAHSYYSKSALFPSITVDNGGPIPSAAAGTNQTVSVVSTDNIVVGSNMLVKRYTAGTYAAPEIISIAAVNSSTSIDIKRGIGASGTQAAIANGTILIEVGNAFEEGSARPVARAVSMAEHTNFTQIFRNSWDVTYTAEAVALEPGVKLMSENKEDAMFLHAQDIEWSTIFGRKDAFTRNGRPIRTMDGIESIVTQFAPNNLHAAAATTTFKQLEAMLHPTKDQIVSGRSSGKKTLFCGSQAIEVINEIGRASGYFELQPNSTTFGMEFMTFKTSRGEWELVEHQLLNAHDQTKSMCIVADVSNFDYLTLRPTKHEATAYDGTDATSGNFTTELTVEMTNPLAWGIIYGLTAGA